MGIICSGMSVEVQRVCQCIGFAVFSCYVCEMSGCASACFDLLCDSVSNFLSRTDARSASQNVSKQNRDLCFVRIVLLHSC